jgi:uncharacterized alkaline shock family protein YloU
VTDEPQADPGQRGRTDVAASVLERIACHAAAEIDGVTSVGSGLGKVVGRQYPRANAEIAGSRARVTVEIAIEWPHPLATVSAQVRDTLTTRLHELSGLEIDAVDVTVAKVALAGQEQGRRVQ